MYGPVWDSFLCVEASLAQHDRKEITIARSSPTDSFTADQIKRVRMLRAKYPAADPERIADLFKDMGFDVTLTLSVLAEQFGQAAPGPAHTLPTPVYAPASPTLMSVAGASSSSVSRSSSSTANFATAAAASVQPSLAYGQFRPLQQLQRCGAPPTHLNNGRITDVGRMAAANGAGKTQEENREDFQALHEKRADRQRQLDEALKKAQCVKDPHARGYYGQEARRAKEARIAVEEEIAALAQQWNSFLNCDTIDLHFLLADQAMALLREKIDECKRSGNNSLGGRPEIKSRVVAMCTTQGYK
eukprot:PDM76043.1 hypothetical protein PRIPAC_39647 [Pristionchus pacificus]